MFHNNCNSLLFRWLIQVSTLCDRSSGVAKPQAMGALAWGVEGEFFGTVAFSSLFDTI
jgi:hypothetical protein